MDSKTEAHFGIEVASGEAEGIVLSIEPFETVQVTATLAWFIARTKKGLVPPS